MLDRHVDAAPALASGDRVGPLASQNLDGVPAAERNTELLGPYLARVRRPR